MSCGLHSAKRWRGAVERAATQVPAKQIKGGRKARHSRWRPGVDPGKDPGVDPGIDPGRTQGWNQGRTQGRTRAGHRRGPRGGIRSWRQGGPKDKTGVDLG